jgi:hypothetical protein
MPVMAPKKAPSGFRSRHGGIALLMSVPVLLLGLVMAVPAGAEVIPPGSPVYGKIYGPASNPANCVDVWAATGIPANASRSW